MVRGLLLLLIAMIFSPSILPMDEANSDFMAHLMNDDELSAVTGAGCSKTQCVTAECSCITIACSTNGHICTLISAAAVNLCSCPANQNCVNSNCSAVSTGGTCGTMRDGDVNPPDDDHEDPWCSATGCTGSPRNCGQNQYTVACEACE